MISQKLCPVFFLEYLAKTTTRSQFVLITYIVKSSSIYHSNRICLFPITSALPCAPALFSNFWRENLGFILSTSAASARASTPFTTTINIQISDFPEIKTYIVFNHTGKFPVGIQAGDFSPYPLAFGHPQTSNIEALTAFSEQGECLGHRHYWILCTQDH